MIKLSHPRRWELAFGNLFQIHLFLPFLILAAYFGNYLPLFLISWGLALLHEGAHLFIGTRLGIGFSGISLQPFGVCAKLKDPIIKSPAKEILTALSGPLCNLVLALLFRMLLIPFPHNLLRYAYLSSLAMGVLNLLPCLPLDGGRILRALLTLGSDALSAWRLSARISQIFVILLLITAIVLLLTASFQFSLLLIGVFLLGNLTNEQKSISHQALRELLYYKEKPERETFTRTGTLTAYQELPARMLLRKLSYHNYYTVHVLDKNQTICKTLTESQILDALLNRSIRITLGEI